MTLELFVSILVVSATATSIAVEIIKTLLNKANITYKTMPVAVIVAFVVGATEIIIHATSNGFSWITVIYAVCMGLANTIGATVGYDTVKAFIYALLGRTK